MSNIRPASSTDLGGSDREARPVLRPAPNLIVTIRHDQASYRRGVHSFDAELEIVDGNPFVPLPGTVLDALFVAAGRSKSPIPVHGSINGVPYRQTLVKFRGAWRLYINMQMLKDSPRRIGEVISVEIVFDPSDRTLEQHPKLVAALAANPQAQATFEGLSPSRQKEIVRYINSLKREESVDRNVARAIAFLTGEARFVGRANP